MSNKIADKKNKKIIYVTDSPEKTKKLGGLLAKSVLKSGGGGRATVLLLRGDLGAGKTQLVQGFAQGLGIKETVSSPTFVIFKKYPLAGRGGFKNFYHVDCYRLKSGRDLETLGMDSVMGAPENIVAMEWPAMVENDLSLGGALEIALETVGENKRKIIFSTANKTNEE
jgi:tRNA threonylcarbamoyladenosine biosynthesis protein TsaE